MKTPPLPSRPKHDLPVDMAAHVTTPRMRVLAVVAFCILTYAQFHLYTDYLAPVVTGDAIFVLDSKGPRLTHRHHNFARISAGSLSELVQDFFLGNLFDIKSEFGTGMEGAPDVDF